MANEITSQNLADAIARVIAARFMDNLHPQFVMAGLVNRDFDANLGSVGDTVNVPIPPVLKASNIAEAGSVTNQNAAVGSAQIALATHAEVSFVIPDVTKAIAHPETTDAFMSAAVLALAEKVEGDLMRGYLYLDKNTAVGSNGADLTEATLALADAALFKARVPQTSPRNLVVNADQYGLLAQIPRFTEAQTSGDPSGISDGILFGKVKGFRVFRHQLVEKVSTTVYNMAFERSALVLASRRLPLVQAGLGAVQTYHGYGMRLTMSYNPSTLSQQFTVDMLYGTGTARPEFGIQVLSR